MSRSDGTADGGAGFRSFLRLERRATPPGGDPASQAVTAEWIVALVRPVGVAVFALIGWLRPPEHAVDLSLLYLFVLVGALYAIYVLHLLLEGRVARELPHYLSFFLLCDILLLAALSYFANIFHQGLLFFFHLLIIVVALRASFRVSLAIGPIIILAYSLSGLLLSEGGGVPTARFLLDAAGLVAVAAVCGWFAERSSRAWLLVGSMRRDLASASSDLDETRRELETVRRTQDLQRDFLAIVSHELRTPLTGIIGYSDLMLLGETGALAPTQREYLQEIMGKGIDLLNLIDNILNSHKVQTGRWLLRLGAVDPGRLLEEALATIRPEAAKKRVRLLTEIEPAQDFPAMTADGEKVRLVLLNILVNAVRYTPAGRAVRVRIEIVIDRELEARFPHLISSAEAVRFSIADEGPGVPPGDEPHIFDLFFRGGGLGADSTPSRMGLGLAVAREIIELHWGRIWHEAAPGGGSLFRFTLPLRPLRLARKIALMTSEFSLEALLEGLLLQFSGELRKKRLVLARRGWPAPQGGRPVRVAADRQLVQSVLFNLLNNKIRYAFPGSEIGLELESGPAPGRVRVRLTNRGEAFPPELLEQINSGEAPGAGGDQDLRHIHVTLAMARDIIESHGGAFRLENLGHAGAAVTLELPEAGGGE